MGLVHYGIYEYDLLGNEIQKNRIAIAMHVFIFLLQRFINQWHVFFLTLLLQL